MKKRPLFAEILDTWYGTYHRGVKPDGTVVRYAVFHDGSMLDLGAWPDNLSIHVMFVPTNWFTVNGNPT